MSNNKPKANINETLNKINSSLSELIVYELLLKRFPDAENHFTKIFNNGMHLDVYIASINTAIEYDGDMWHNSLNSLDRDKRKFIICKQNGIRLIRITENYNVNTNNCDKLFYRRGTVTASLIKPINELLSFLGSKDAVMKEEIIECDHSVRAKVIEDLYGRSLANTNPEIAALFIVEKNKGLLPTQITSGASDNYWFYCVNPECRHPHLTSPFLMCKGIRCGYCSGKRAISGVNDALTVAPERLSDWDYEKNELGPDRYLPRSNEKVHWKCELGHPYEQTVCSHIAGTGCPYCSNKKVWPGFNDFQTKYPVLAELYSSTNPLKANEVLPNYWKKVEWKCSACGDIFSASPNEIVQRYRKGRRIVCSTCAPSNGKAKKGKNDLLTLRPKLCNEWNKEQNPKGLDEYTLHSGKTVYWNCPNPQCGKVYPAQISARVDRGATCPYCGKGRRRVNKGKTDLKTLFPLLVENEWDYEKNPIPPEEYSAHSGDTVYWHCKICGRKWHAKISNRTRFGDRLCQHSNRWSNK